MDDSRGASCTVAIAFIDQVPSAFPLPGRPPGLFGRTDKATMYEIIHRPGNINLPVLGCLWKEEAYRPPWEGLDPKMGWAQAGRKGNIGIFVVATGSLMDRMIPPGIVVGTPELTSETSVA